jgi:hypothetical protein
VRNRPRRIEHATLRIHDLGERFTVLDQRPLRRLHGPPVGDKSREILAAPTEILVERAAEIRAHAGVREPAGARQHDGHGEREDQGKPDADRDATHALSSRNR